MNLALDDYLSIAIQASGRWQFDDSGHSKYPTIKTNLVSGQRDYAFTVDEQSNLILDIYKVMVLPSDTATLYQEVYPFDAQSEGDDDISIENTVTGTPYHYDKQANAIFLDPAPSYNATNGLKIFINREANYFTTASTTAKPGVPGTHHEYFVLKPALAEARQKNLANYEKLREAVLDFEGDEKRGITGKIEKYFAKREKDVRHRLTGKKINYI